MGTGIVGSFRSATQDRSVLKKKVAPGTLKRTLGFAAPYAALLAVFLLVVVVDAGVGVASPLVYRAIINDGILKGSIPLIVRLAALLALLGIVDAALGLVQSFLAATVGARIVLRLRTELFDHIQQMPLAFFTRTQTGALVSRLGTDVGGARTAFTDILSNGIGNLVTVALILGAMFVLSWRITLAALILLPAFVFPARIWGRKLQEITRESYDLHAGMNNTMVERFNVAGAQLAKLFGRRHDESGAFTAKANGSPTSASSRRCTAACSSRRSSSWPRWPRRWPTAGAARSPCATCSTSARWLPWPRTSCASTARSSGSPTSR